MTSAAFNLALPGHMDAVDCVARRACAFVGGPVGLDSASAALVAPSRTCIAVESSSVIAVATASVFGALLVGGLCGLG